MVPPFFSVIIAEHRAIKCIYAQKTHQHMLSQSNTPRGLGCTCTSLNFFDVPQEMKINLPVQHQWGVSYPDDKFCKAAY